MRFTGKRKETTYSVYQVVPTVMTEKAVLLVMVGDPDSDLDGVWVPKSVIHEECRDELEVGVVAEIEIANWWLEKNL